MMKTMYFLIPYWKSTYSHISNEGVGGNVTGKSNIVCDIVDTACKVY